MSTAERLSHCKTVLNISWEFTILLSQQPFLGVSNVAFIIVSPYHCTPCLRLPCSLKGWKASTLLPVMFLQPSYHVTWGNWGLLSLNLGSIRKRAQLCSFYYILSLYWASLSFSPVPKNSPRLKTYPGHRDDTRSKQASRSLLSNPVFFDLESLFALNDIIHHLGTKQSTMWVLSHMSTVLNRASSSKIIELGWFLSLQTAQTDS